MYLRAFTDVYDGIRGLLFPPRYEFGFTADMDNTGFPAHVLNEFRTMFAKDMTWWMPTASQKRRFKVHPKIGKVADNLIAVSRDGRQEFWVMDNDWAGFPDPAEFLFLGFERDRTIFAAGQFEDWPQNWKRT